VKTNEPNPPEPEDEDKEVDLFRETNVRYLGYANEVGESFRFVTPTLVGPSYVVAFGYVFADTIDKGIKSYKANGGQLTRNLTIETLDCLIW